MLWNCSANISTIVNSYGFDVGNSFHSLDNARIFFFCEKLLHCFGISIEIPITIALRIPSAFFIRILTQIFGKFVGSSFGISPLICLEISLVILSDILWQFLEFHRKRNGILYYCYQVRAQGKGFGCSTPPIAIDSYTPPFTKNRKNFHWICRQNLQKNNQWNSYENGQRNA